jgi:hypothetical protein
MNLIERILMAETYKQAYEGEKVVFQSAMEGWQGTIDLVKEVEQINTDLLSLLHMYEVDLNRFGCVLDTTRSIAGYYVEGLYRDQTLQETHEDGNIR